MSEGWGSLKAIIEEARADQQEVKNRPLVDCPFCGAVLQRNSRGEANCEMGHYRTSARTLGEAGLA
jgi:hypothetical protein